MLLSISSVHNNSLGRNYSRSSVPPSAVTKPSNCSNHLRLNLKQSWQTSSPVHNDIKLVSPTFTFTWLYFWWAPHSPELIICPWNRGQTWTGERGSSHTEHYPGRHGLLCSSDLLFWLLKSLISPPPHVSERRWEGKCLWKKRLSEDVNMAKMGLERIFPHCFYDFKIKGQI